MKDTFTLRVVQDLARKRSDAAAVKLGTLNAEAAKAEGKLNMLLEYREEYRERFRRSAHEDVHSASWRNFQQFLEKLDEAVEQQRAAVIACQEAVHRGQREWQTVQKEVKGYETLEQRHRTLLAERAKKIEQRVTDDLAARAYTAKG